MHILPEFGLVRFVIRPSLYDWTEIHRKTDGNISSYKDTTSKILQSRKKKKTRI